MRTIQKIGLAIVLLVLSFVLAYLLFPGDVVAIRVQAEAPRTTKQIIKDVWGEKSSIAIRIATCESGLNPNAVNYEDSKLNGHVSRGLFQLSEINGKIENWQDPEVNAQKALELYKKNGWTPWYNCATKLRLI